MTNGDNILSGMVREYYNSTFERKCILQFTSQILLHIAFWYDFVTSPMLTGTSFALL